ncbi:hypothetical protein HS1genome_1446 [Sulfodiicoccus acidiphilus]|uniref:Glycosyltransferase 2-like domain-containing protein n=1 Tax=Sulfodiicoccus acidiphilus TaxID=1670455 RepID=A0A348B4F5_9CREN|nr:glycosyltransferase family 2 protein [Sulfodiicoccus acidiphilus]BBD73057.1 hypothetical protein HS1genome_1446 [Sulfodiicoccus acidiphilus]GGU03948.1 hypothetical protein GCM10007116_20940 [Sulfodiicoccus acidiphilus]
MIAELLLALCCAASCSWLLSQIYYASHRALPLEERPGRAKYSVVVAVKDEEVETLNELRECLLNLDYGDYEVLVVSDDAPERRDEVTRALRGLRVLFRDSPSGGKAGALNYASSFVTGTHLVFLDAEARVGRDFLLTLSRFAGYDVLALRLTVRNAQGPVGRAYSSTTDFSFRSLFAGRDSLGLFLFPNGSALVVRREVLDSLGWWRPTMAEDLDLGVRLALKGVRVRYLDLAVSTMAPLSTGELHRQISRWGYGSGELAPLSLKLLGMGVRGIEGWAYVNQWLLYPLYPAALLIYSLLSPAFGLGQLSVLVTASIYGVTLSLYGRFVRGDPTLGVLTTFSALSGYVRGLLRVPMKWKVTKKAGTSASYPLSLFLFGEALGLLSPLYVLLGYPLQSLVLLGLGVTLAWSSRPPWM